jgi:hypothetical protein
MNNKVLELLQQSVTEYRDGFTDGILYAEKHHGIGE